MNKLFLVCGLFLIIALIGIIVVIVVKNKSNNSVVDSVIINELKVKHLKDTVNDLKKIKKMYGLMEVKLDINFENKTLPLTFDFKLNKNQKFTTLDENQFHQLYDSLIDMHPRPDVVNLINKTLNKSFKNAYIGNGLKNEIALIEDTLLFNGIRYVDNFNLSAKLPVFINQDIVMNAIKDLLNEQLLNNIKTTMTDNPNFFYIIKYYCTIDVDSKFNDLLFNEIKKSVPHIITSDFLIDDIENNN